eukprot:scaffold179049_cov31-Tisochrysis_lutea.AAC.2
MLDALLPLLLLFALRVESGANSWRTSCGSGIQLPSHDDDDSSQTANSKLQGGGLRAQSKRHAGAEAARRWRAVPLDSGACFIS